jgi:hypothetical protein
VQRHQTWWLEGSLLALRRFPIRLAALHTTHPGRAFLHGVRPQWLVATRPKVLRAVSKALGVAVCTWTSAVLRQQLPKCLELGLPLVAGQERLEGSIACKPAGRESRLMPDQQRIIVGVSVEEPPVTIRTAVEEVHLVDHRAARKFRGESAYRPGGQRRAATSGSVSPLKGPTHQVDPFLDRLGSCPLSRRALTPSNDMPAQ